ncbi:MAG: tRNA (adenosine(37)-N6)-threonylcarbamoyltransferase complex dimerization subunit type 1 TsaB [Ruminococcus sp.]
MRILGIDTSGKVAAAALYDSESRCLLAQQTVYTKRTHSQVILPLAERLLADTGLNWQDVDGFAAAKGPGSYTGLRIGIAAVKAMSYALQIPCVGISTLEGLAWQNLSWQGVICAVMTARQSLVYAGLYAATERSYSVAGRNAAGAELSEQLSAWENRCCWWAMQWRVPAAAFLHAASPATNCKTVPASAWQRRRHRGRPRRN